MGEEQGDSVLDIASLMDVVDIERSEPINLDVPSELVKGIQFGFNFPPVESVLPIRKQSLYVAERDPVMSLCILELVWKPSLLEFNVKFLKIGVGDRNSEWSFSHC